MGTTITHNITSYIQAPVFADGSKSLSPRAHVLYQKLLDLLKIAKHKKQMDPDGTPYVYFSMAAIMNFLSCAKGTARKVLSELCDTGYVSLRSLEDRKAGKGRTYYVTDFMAELRAAKTINERSMPTEETLVVTSGVGQKMTPNNLVTSETDIHNKYTNINQREQSSDRSSVCVTSCDAKSSGEENVLEAMMSELVHDYPEHLDLLKKIRKQLSLGLHTRSSRTVCGRNYDAEYIRERFEDIEINGLRGLMDRLTQEDDCLSRVANVNAYIFAALFNLNASREESKVLHRVAKAVGLQYTVLPESAEKVIRNWLSVHTLKDVLRACEKTICATGGRNAIKYCDTILRRWATRKNRPSDAYAQGEMNYVRYATGGYTKEDTSYLEAGREMAFGMAF